MPKRIVHIDQDQQIRAIVKTCLEECGYLVVSCSTTTEYHDALKDIPDLIITELDGEFKPDNKSGWNLHKERNSKPELREIPVMALTVLAEDAQVFRGWQSGIDCYLTKPFRPIEVVTLVKRIFESLEDDKNIVPDEPYFDDDDFVG